MPIRFRCAYCNQLMGISRRKAGKVVRCPKCAGEIIVPVPDGEEGPAEEPEQLAAAPMAFEDPKFEQTLHPPAAPPEPPSATAAVQTEAAPDAAPPPPGPTVKRLGLFLPLGMLIVSLGVVVLLLILMFVLGLIIGLGTVSSDKAA